MSSMDITFLLFIVISIILSLGVILTALFDIFVRWRRKKPQMYDLYDSQGFLFSVDADTFNSWKEILEDRSEDDTNAIETKEEREHEGQEDLGDGKPFREETIPIG